MSVLKKCLETYVSDKNYAALYLFPTLSTTATLCYATFTGSWLLSSGLGLHWILLLFGFEFLFMGLTSPLGLRIVLKMGVFKTALISNAITGLGCVCVALGTYHYVFLIIGVLLRALAAGIINPTTDIIHAVYIEDHNRGRSYMLAQVMTSVTAIVSLGIVGALLVSVGYWGLVAFTVFLLLINTLPFAILDERIKGSVEIDVRHMYARPLEKEFRPYFLAFAGEQFSILTKYVVMPIFLFTLAGSFETMTAVVVFALIGQLVIFMTFGHWMDRTKGLRPLLAGSVADASGMLFYAALSVFSVKTPVLLTLAEGWHKTASFLYKNAFRKEMHAHIRQTAPSLVVFGTAWQMSLCYAEFVTLGLFAALAFLFGTQALPVILGLCAAGVFLGYIQMRKINAGSSSKIPDTTGR